jgi:hypothetical protein
MVGGRQENKRTENLYNCMPESYAYAQLNQQLFVSLLDCSKTQTVKYIVKLNVASS